MSTVTLHLGDCLPAMRAMPDKVYDLAIVDPPYGLGDKLAIGGGDHLKFSHSYRNGDKWDVVPDEEYFSELRRISVNQIIWGGNYFDLGPSRGFIIWDKKQVLPNFSSCEFAWTSFDRVANMYSFSCTGGPTDKGKIHPTQKPVPLYKWLLKHYANPGHKIIDTHGGSMSIAIACHDLGFDLDLWEINPDYHEAGVKRYHKHIEQLQLFH